MKRIQLLVFRPQEYLYIDYFINPLPVAAVILFGLNDHFLKVHYPSWFTGKLSDLLGMFFFPLLLCALYGLVRNFLIRKGGGRIIYLTKGGLISSILITATLLILLNIFPYFTEILKRIYGIFHLHVSFVHDRWDLLALGMGPLTYLYGKNFIDKYYSTKSKKIVQIMRPYSKQL